MAPIKSNRRPKAGVPKQSWVDDDSSRRRENGKTTENRSRSADIMPQNRSEIMTHRHSLQHSLTLSGNVEHEEADAHEGKLPERASKESSKATPIDNLEDSSEGKLEVLESVEEMPGGEQEKGGSSGGEEKKPHDKGEKSKQEEVVLIEIGTDRPASGDKELLATGLPVRKRNKRTGKRRRCEPCGRCHRCVKCEKCRNRLRRRRQLREQRHKERENTSGDWIPDGDVEPVPQVQYAAVQSHSGDGVGVSEHRLLIQGIDSGKQVVYDIPVENVQMQPVPPGLPRYDRYTAVTLLAAVYDELRGYLMLFLIIFLTIFAVTFIIAGVMLSSFSQNDYVSESERFVGPVMLVIGGVLFLTSAIMLIMYLRSRSRLVAQVSPAVREHGPAAAIYSFAPQEAAPQSSRLSAQSAASQQLRKSSGEARTAEHSIPPSSRHSGNVKHEGADTPGGQRSHRATLIGNIEETSEGQPEASASVEGKGGSRGDEEENMAPSGSVQGKTGA